VTDQSAKAARFLELHRPGQPLLMPNPWDPGAAKVLTAAGFEALATTSSGAAGALGRADGALTRDEVIAAAAAIVAATDVPVSADMEHCFGDDAAGVAETARLVVDAGLAGFSIEDYIRTRSEPILPLEEAAERVAAVVAVAHGGAAHVVVTARAENHIRGRDDLADTIARLQAYAAAGADAVFAPGLPDLEAVARVVSEVGRPLSVLYRPGGPTIAELAGVGVARISVGGSFFYVAMGALAAAAEDLKAGREDYGASLAGGFAAVKAAAFSR
jgi:2-methylisocitrate lyase-like PEP mutase family enzyme